MKKRKYKHRSEEGSKKEKKYIKYDEKGEKKLHGNGIREKRRGKHH